MEKIQENNYFSCKPEFSSATKTSSFIKNTKNNHSSASDWRGTTKCNFKENTRTFSKSSTIQQNIRMKFEICAKTKFQTKNQNND